MSSLQCNVRTCLTDVDGTLFPFGSNRRLSDNNRVALQRAIEAGVHVGLATGRIPGAWSQSIRETLPSLGASVFCNGALVLGSDSCVIAESTLPLDAICRVRDYTRGGRAGGQRRPRPNSRACGHATLRRRRYLPRARARGTDVLHGNHSQRWRARRCRPGADAGRPLRIQARSGSV